MLLKNKAEARAIFFACREGLRYVFELEICTRRLGEVAVRRCSGVFDTLEVFALDKRLDSLFDHVNIGLELRRELSQRLSNQLLM